MTSIYSLSSSWEYVRLREKKADEDVDCVVMVTVLKRPLMFDCLLLVKQYRPSLRAYTLEFPSTLVNANESAEAAALREIHHLTGYHGDVRSIGEVTALDAGISNCTLRLITLEVNAGEEHNKHIRLQHHKGVALEVVPLPIGELHHRLLDYVHNGVVVDSRVEMYAMGLRANWKSLSSPAV